jgi:signal transduction histidine kinase
MIDIFSTIQSLNIYNLDLLGVGIAVSILALLGFIVYVSNTKSISNIAFFLFSCITIVWSFFNYIIYQVENQEVLLLLWRVVIFCAFWYAFMFFTVLYLFPKEKHKFPSWYKYILLPWVLILSVFTLGGNLVFSGINKNLEPIPSSTIGLFVVTSFSLVILGFIFLIKKIIKTEKKKKTPYVLILIGSILTFTFIFYFNVVLPVFFKNLLFIPLGAIAILPFASFTAYAIFKHKTFKVHHIGPTFLAFLLSVATFIEIIFSEGAGQLILRSGIFLFVLLINIQFVKNIFVLETLTDKLEDANEKLKSLDKLKSEFVSLASHQLRSPLTVIKGYAAMLVDDDLKENQAEMARHIYTSAQGMANVVEDFLNVTKIEQGGMKYIFAETDVRTIINDLVSDMRLSAEAKHLQFLAEVDLDGKYTMNVDGTKLKQVFLNLIDNSIKYTKEGFVKVGLRKENDSMVFFVSDSGVGVSEESRQKLFQKFNRGGGEGAAINTGGSGLGLYLAQEIVKAHKGEITIESPGVGKGSTFSVVLPLL